MASMIDTEHFRGKAAASQGTGGTGGGSVDDILKRLGTVESSVFSIAGDVREMKGVLQSLATKSEVESVRTDVESVRTEVEKVRTEIAIYASSVIKWLVGTMIASTTLAFAAAKLLH